MNAAMLYGARRTESEWLGAMFSAHYRRRAREDGSSVYHAARQMRKQGFPLVAALVTLRGVRR